MSNIYEKHVNVVYVFFRVSGLYVIQITDRDGVPLLRVNQSKEKNVDFALMPSFIPTFTTACDQASKLGLGRNKTIISMYSNYQVGAYIYIESHMFY